jgi:hypothetical protein
MKEWRMTMTNVEKNELISVLEEIRSTKYPDVPAELIVDIVSAEFDSLDDRAKARKDAQKVIDDFLKQVSVP